ncbi:MAG: MBL fold metallo-hydrolase [Thermomicrobiales bacterium]
MDVRWDVLTIGHLSRNKFWGESDDRSYRAPRCTSCLLRTDGLIIVVDPALPPDGMVDVLDQRAGIVASAVDIVFLTHFHGDHRVGLDAFPDATWYMAAPEIDYWRGELEAGSEARQHLDRVHPIGEELVTGIAVVPTPGHTYHHASLLFESDGARVVVAADAVMTEAFFVNRAYYFNTVDAEAAVASIEKLDTLADVIIPGHDNYFLNDRNLG